MPHSSDICIEIDAYVRSTCLIIVHEPILTVCDGRLTLREEGEDPHGRIVDSMGKHSGDPQPIKTPPPVPPPTKDERPPGGGKREKPK